MNINFHYCAVKVIAMKAGFKEPEADVIATYSQFVDDYKTKEKLKLTNVPGYARRLVNSRGEFETVPSGFSYLGTLSSETQRNVVIPFHFIPPKSLRETGEDYRTTPAAYHDQSIMDDICGSAVSQYAGAPNRGGLILLGTAMHVLADTYAHQYFNGFNDNVNDGKVTDAISARGERRTYWIERWLPTIGHARFSTAPDESDLNYTFEHLRPDGTGKETLKRNNWDHFGECSRQIFRYFTDALREEWSKRKEDDLVMDVIFGFSCKGTEMADLAPHWRKLPEYSTVSFAYDPKRVLAGMLPLAPESLPGGLTPDDAYELLLMGSEEPEEDGENGEAKRGSRRRAADLFTTASDDFYQYNNSAFEVRKAALNGKIA